VVVHASIVGQSGHGVNVSRNPQVEVQAALDSPYRLSDNRAMTHTTEANQSLDYTAGDVVRELCTALDEEWRSETSITLHRPGHGWAMRLVSVEYGQAVGVYVPRPDGSPRYAFQVFTHVVPIGVAVAGVRAILDAQLDAIQAAR
jgi:hypothetical protein